MSPRTIAAARQKLMKLSITVVATTTLTRGETGGRRSGRVPLCQKLLQLKHLQSVYRSRPCIGGI